MYSEQFYHKIVTEKGYTFYLGKNYTCPKPKPGDDVWLDYCAVNVVRGISINRIDIYYHQDKTLHKLLSRVVARKEFEKW